MFISATGGREFHIISTQKLHSKSVIGREGKSDTHYNGRSMESFIQRKREITMFT